MRCWRHSANVPRNGLGLSPDLIELAGALRAIYENREEADRRGRLAAERIVQTHAWLRLMEKYIEHIGRLVASRNSPMCSVSSAR